MIVDTAVPTARELLDIIYEHGVRSLIISPGSRNTPLIIGAAAREKFKKYIINDERTAAFTALGIAMVSQSPVALICTSGSALYNYAPAVAEAFYNHIPLIVISADRPIQWIGQDSQTLNQPDALSHIVKAQFEIPAQSDMPKKTSSEYFQRELMWHTNRIVNSAMISAMSGIKGPVHINIAFEVPFNDTVPHVTSTPRIIQNLNFNIGMPFHVTKDIAELLIRKKVVIIAGSLQPNHKLNRALLELSKYENFMVVCEPSSNLHLSSISYHADMILSSLSSEERKQLKPDVLICIGGKLVSEKIKSFLKASEIKECWTLADNSFFSDYYMRVNRHFNVEPSQFFMQIANGIKYLKRKKGNIVPAVTFTDNWKRIEKQRLKQIDSFINNEKWNEPKALHFLLKKIPVNYNLFVSNGQIIRYVFNLFQKMPHSCWANRGVSGIEGTNATAFGCSLAYNGTTLLLTGDMSFSYDLDILNLSKQYGNDLKIIVINNRGGGIFREIETTRNLECREEYFCSDPKLPLENLSKAYGWYYFRANSMESLETGIDNLILNPHSLLEIIID